MENIDIIIPTYNKGNLLNKTLFTISRQTISIDLIKVIIIDDGSADDTFQIVKEYDKILNIKYIYQEDKGYRVASARNLGLHEGSSKICVLIDSGILLESHCIENHYNFHRKFIDPIAIIGYCHGYVPKETNINYMEAIFREIKDIDKIINYIESNRQFLDVREEEFKKFNYEIDKLPAPWAYFWGGHLSINRKCLTKSGIFDTIFEPRYGYEDIDLGYSLYQAGIKIYLNCEAKALHYPHPKKDNYSNDLKMNSELFNKKHMSSKSRLFVENGGTLGFNEFLIKNNIIF